MLTKEYLLKCKAKGMKRQEIADEAKVSLPTVGNYLTKFFGRKTQKKVIATKPVRQLSASQCIGIYSKWVTNSPELKYGHGVAA
jgi:orotate phosphoribosyltransferase-like protein